MSWVPPNLSAACASYTTISSCAPLSFLFLQLVSSLLGQPGDNLNSTKSTKNKDEQLETYTEVLRREYDFIIVGAGSAGCVVANRLSEIRSWSVLLLEAGIEEPDVVHVPGLAPLLQNSNVEWGTMTQPSTQSCTARPQGRCPWIHGRVMGGSSSLNYMVYMRGNPLDYDEWEKLGNPGWSFKNVFPYFLKSEDNQNLDVVNPDYHSQGGYQSVSIQSYQDSNIFSVIDAFQEVGLPLVDQNAEQQIGVSLVQGTVRNGRRVSTNMAFIKPIRNKRKNLTIKTSANVARVLINPNTKTAYGVQYFKNNRIYTVRARKEVILSAGAINSPKILMLSGVGPSTHLRSRKIEVIKDLPVGRNLHDHTTLDGLVWALNETSTMVDDNQRNADLHFYQSNMQGPLSSSALLQLSAMVQTKYAKDERPEIQYLFDATNVQNFFTDPILASQTNVNPMAYYDGITVRPILLNPASRGIVMLNDSDPVLGAALVFPNTFAEKIDVMRIIDGIRQSMGLLNTETFRKLNIRLVNNQLPACVHQKFDTDDYWRCLLTSYTSSMNHPVGTCKMGLKNDKTAVVNADLQVHGVRSLRVIDTSIMPVIVRGNTNAPAIMIAEMGSDFIKKKWASNLNQHSSSSTTSQFDVKAKTILLDYIRDLLKYI